MPDITLTISSAGLDTGPFTITDNLGNTLATGVTRAELLAGYPLYNVDSAVTLINVTSTGVCQTAASVTVNFGGGGGGVTCSFVRFYITPSQTGCRIYQLSVQEGGGQASFDTVACGLTTHQTVTLNEGEYFDGCFAEPPIVTTGFGNVVRAGSCGTGGGSGNTYLVNFVYCDGSAGVVSLSNLLTEYTVCIQNGSGVYPAAVSMEVVGPCLGPILPE